MIKTKHLFQFKFSVNIALALLLSLSFSFIGQNSFALPNLFNSKKYDDLNSRGAKLTSKATHRKLRRVQDMINNEKYDNALEFLEKMAPTATREFEKAQIIQMMGFINAQANRNSAAIKNFKDTLELNALPIGPTMMSTYILAQLYIGNGDYKKGEQYLLDWFSLAEKPTAQAYILLATIYSETKRKQQALDYVDQAISMSDSPKESWLQFSVALNFELKNYKAASVSLRFLTGMFPQKKKYWKQLTGVYLNLNQFDKSLAALELAHKWGHLDEETELINLVSLFMLQGYPYEAGKLLAHFIEKGQVKRTKKHLEILAQAWLQSEEVGKALEPLGEAAKQAENGQLWAQQGQLLMELEQWDKAIAALEKGIQKGHLRAPERIYMILGVAKFNNKDLEGAKKAFENAKKYEKTQKSAEQWLIHLST